MNYRRGDEIEVLVDREGLGADQGVGHLPDETMVVVVGVGDKIGESVRATVIGIEQTSLGSSLLANAV